MSEKRKDKKGRILKTGESQRSDLTYQYRYKNLHNQWQYAYAPTLGELRQKEAAIQKDLNDGIDYAAGKVTVIELLERYISLKQGVRHNTKVGYNFVLNLVKREEFGRRRIKDIKISDAKLWFMKLSQDGRGYSTITSVRGVVKPAFQMAYNEDIIRKNPFDFRIDEVVPNDTEKRIALTPEQLKLWMDFIKTDRTYSKYYDEFIVLLETGMRVSEFCGLTRKDLDFEKRKIRVERQLLRERNGKYFVEETKTESGRRFIHMTDDAYNSLLNILARRPSVSVERIIDGHAEFLMLDKNNNPKVALHIENEMRWAMKKYCKLHPDKPLPHITPHVFRHTFCTNMANAGMDLKDLQYFMGHSDAGITMNVYTHANYDHAAKQMAKIVAIKKTGKQPDSKTKTG